MSDEYNYYNTIGPSTYADPPPRTPFLAPTTYGRSSRLLPDSEPEDAPVLTRPTLCPTMVTTTSIQLHGLTLTMLTAKTEIDLSGALYPKKSRPAKDEARLEFVILIQAKQQTLFHATAVSANDPEKMNSTHSIAMILTACKQNLLKFGIDRLH